LADVVFVPDTPKNKNTKKILSSSKEKIKKKEL
jgi:hypothetical protein